MNYSIRLRGYLSLLILLLLLGVGFGAFSETLRVCEIDCEYESIGEAVRSADSGDSIRVQNGNYEENLRIDKRITISGTNPRWVRIRPKRKDRPAIKVGPSSVSVKLSNLTVRRDDNGGGDAITVTGRTNLEMEDVTVGGSSRGVRALDSSTLKLRSVEIRGAKEAVLAQDSSEIVAHESTITGADSGLTVTNSAELTAIGTSILNCTGAGILGTKTGEINLLSGKVSDNEGAGIKMIDFSRLDMEESSVKSNGRGGVLLKDSAVVTLTENEIAYNGAPNLGIISKECGFSGPVEGFFGELNGTNNEIKPADSGSICPPRFSRVTSSEGNGYSYPLKPSTYAFIGLVGAASLVFFLSRF
ncbi:MAG: right-handed parallel beta-helix repeat-containing protein [Candidatus Acetothermia bacterium]